MFLQRIYGTVSVESSYSVNVRDPEELIRNSDVVAVISAVVGNIRMGIMTDTGGSTPYTPVEIVSFTILAGEVTDNLNIAYINGGIVPLSDYAKAIGNERATKMGIDKLSDEEMKTQYVDVELDSSYSFELGEEYVLILLQDEDGKYIINTGGYGVFTVNSQSKEAARKSTGNNPENVLSGNALYLELLKEIDN